MMRVKTLVLLFLVLLLYCTLAGEKGAPFWAPNAGTPAQRFDLAKRSTPELIMFVRKMPKYQ
jgi:integral membrane sensor domain MASE1